MFSQQNIDQGKMTNATLALMYITGILILLEIVIMLSLGRTYFKYKIDYLLSLGLVMFEVYGSLLLMDHKKDDIHMKYILVIADYCIIISGISALNCLSQEMRNYISMIFRVFHHMSYFLLLVFLFFVMYVVVFLVLFKHEPDSILLKSAIDQSVNLVTMNI